MWHPEHGIFVDIHKGVETIKFNPNYWEAWNNAIDYVTRTNSIESSDRTLPIIVVHSTGFGKQYARLQVIRRKRRKLFAALHKHNKNLKKLTSGLL